MIGQRIPAHQFSRILTTESSRGAVHCSGRWSSTTGGCQRINGTDRIIPIYSGLRSRPCTADLTGCLQASGAVLAYRLMMGVNFMTCHVNIPTCRSDFSLQPLLVSQTKQAIGKYRRRKYLLLSRYLARIRR